MPAKAEHRRTARSYPGTLSLLLCGLMATCGLRQAACQISTSAAPAGQGAAAPAAAPAASSAAQQGLYSRADLFAGYSYIDPRSSYHGKPYNSLDQGMIFSAAYFFSHHLGLQAEGSYHFQSVNDGFYTLAAGPILRFPFASGFTPFLHVLAGESQVTGPNIPTIGTSTFFYNPGTWGLNLTGGAGVDQTLPFFSRHLALRIAQVDYQYMHPNFGPAQQTTGGGYANIQAIRASTGLVYHLGSFQPPPALGLACTANPTSVYPGEQVSVSSVLSNMNPKKPLKYTWASSGGGIMKGASSNAANATVDTTDFTAGTYTIAGAATQGSDPGETASCTILFTVNALLPPTVSCSANPSTVSQGDMSTITAQGYSPQNRPLTYSYRTTAGSILGTGATATLGTQGAPPGTITVTCNVVDDKGKSASANADVLVQMLAPKPLPSTQDLCSILFVRDKKRPTRVDNEAKACLDQVALNLQRSPDANIVVVGNAAADEAAGLANAAQRAVNTKAYLVTEKGIDGSRILVRTGTANSKMVSNYLLPSGADFEHDVPNTTPVGSGVTAQKRVPLATRQPAKHSAKKPAAAPTTTP